MEYRTVIATRIKKKRQILFSKEDEIIQLLQEELDKLSRKATILWALDLAEETAKVLIQKYPDEYRAIDAVEETRRWASGESKMPQAKRRILECHAAAKNTLNQADIARYHAIGQACGTVHTVRHAIGFPIYDLTALVRELDEEDWDECISKRMNEYISRMKYWRKQAENKDQCWADFIRKSEDKC